MIFDRNRGRGRDCDFGGRGHEFVGGGRGSYGRVSLRKAPDNVGIVDITITSPKSAGRNLNVLSGHNFLILVLLPRVVLRVFHLLFMALSRFVLSQEEYDRLRQLEFSQNDLSATHASASSMHAYTVSPQSAGY